MKLYEIDEAILNLVDKETGEILDFEEFENLHMERKQKLINIGLWIKSLKAEAEAIANEEKVLADRRKSKEKKAERLKEYLQRALNGEKIDEPNLVVGYRASESVEVDNDFVDWAVMNNREDLLTPQKPKPNKAAIKSAINSGEQFEFACLSNKNNIQIR